MFKLFSSKLQSPHPEIWEGRLCRDTNEHPAELQDFYIMQLNDLLQVSVKNKNSDKKILDVILYDITGRQISKAINVDDYAAEINISSLATGSYILSVKTFSDNLAVKINLGKK